jgi:hypothetical protein
MGRYSLRNLFIFVTYVLAIRCGVFLERSSLRATSFLMTHLPEESSYFPSYEKDFHREDVRSHPEESRHSNLKRLSHRSESGVRVGRGDRRIRSRSPSPPPSIGIRHSEAIFWSVLVGGFMGFGCLRWTDSGDH